MNSILMIAGVAILIGVATAAGLVETMTEFLSTQVPTFMIPGMLIVMAAFLSFFSSGTAVVCPLMYPLVPGLAVSTGLNPIMLFSVIFIGAMSAALSPFSTGGAMVIGGCPDPEVKEKLTNWMIIVASVVIPVIAVIAATIGIFSLFTI
jgi:di/tricarboxylate transporter